jgi:hypothetical protein
MKKNVRHPHSTATRLPPQQCAINRGKRIAEHELSVRDRGVTAVRTSMI